MESIANAQQHQIIYSNIMKKILKKGTRIILLWNDRVNIIN